MGKSLELLKEQGQKGINYNITIIHGNQYNYFGNQKRKKEEKSKWKKIASYVNWALRIFLRLTPFIPVIWKFKNEILSFF